jgi:uncharacterized protein (TIRG00374 family)
MFSRLDIEIFTQQVGSISWPAALFLVFLGLLGDATIAARWKFLSRAKCSFRAAFEAFMVSQYFNNLLPARIGEFTRVAYLKTFYGTKIASGLSALFIERIFDVAILGTLTVAAVHFFIEIPELERLSLGTVIGLSIFLVFLQTQRRLLMQLLKLLPIRSLRTHLRKIVHDMHRILTVRKVVGMTSITVVLWVVYFSITAGFLAFAAHIELRLAEYFVVFVVSSIAMSIPLAPAGAGTYHAGLMFALGFYGVGKEEALAAAFVLHLVQVAPPMLVAILIFWSKDMDLRSPGQIFGLMRRNG